MTAKFTGVFIVPVLCLIAAIDFWQSKNSVRSLETVSARQMVTAIAVALMIGVGCVWTLYHFRYAARPDSLQLNPTSEQYLQKLTSPLSRSVLTTNEQASRLTRGLHLRIGRHEDLSWRSPELSLRANLLRRFALVFPSCLPHQEHAAIPDSAWLNDRCCF